MIPYNITEMLMQVTHKMDAMKLSDARTAEGAELKISHADGKVMAGDATVTQADIMASNGVIHVIDKVLMPPQG